MFGIGIQLAMAAAVAATTVEPATAAVETIAAVKAAITAAETFPTAESAITATETFVAVVAAASVEAMAVIAATTVEAAAIVAAVEPWAGADEDAADEVVRAIVAVGRAGVRIVAVVTVGADRRGAVNWAYADADANLRVGAARRGEKQNSQQCTIFQVTHNVPLVPAWPVE